MASSTGIAGKGVDEVGDGRKFNAGPSHESGGRFCREGREWGRGGAGGERGRGLKWVEHARSTMVERGIGSKQPT